MNSVTFFTCAVTIFTAHACTWTAPDQHQYDFSSLIIPAGQEEYKAEDETSIFIGNICQKSEKCSASDADGMLCQYDLKSGDYVTTLAKYAEPLWQYIEPTDPGIGVRMTYRNGDMCQRTLPSEHTTFIAPRDVVYLFVCTSSEQQKDGSLLTVVNEVDECLTVATFHTTLACVDPLDPGLVEPAPVPVAEEPPISPSDSPTKESNQESKTAAEEKTKRSRFKFIGYLLVVGALLYCFAGCFCNYRKGLSGIDAVPNKDFWTAVPSCCLGVWNWTVGMFPCCSSHDYELLPSSG